jgi:hypothetical protein
LDGHSSTHQLTASHHLVNTIEIVQPSASSAQASSTAEAEKCFPFKPEVFRDGGKYVHFGLEAGIAGDSPGIYHKYADLLQYIPIYNEDVSFLPECIKSKVSFIQLNVCVASKISNLIHYYDLKFRLIT